MTPVLAALFENISTETLAGWAAILSGMSLVGIIWIGHNMYKLARNQVRLATMLRELLEK